jgi:hypothetical protein
MGYLTLRSRTSTLIIDSDLDMDMEGILLNQLLTELGYSLLQENGDYLLLEEMVRTGYNITINGGTVSTDCILRE